MDMARPAEGSNVNIQRPPVSQATHPRIDAVSETHSLASTLTNNKDTSSSSSALSMTLSFSPLPPAEKTGTHSMCI